MTQIQEQYRVPLLDVREIGRVKDVRRGIARIKGLQTCAYGQLVQFSAGMHGLVMGFDEKDVMATIFGDENGVSVGDEVLSYEAQASIPVGEGFLGRVISSLGDPLDGRGPVTVSGRSAIFREAPGIMEREPVMQQMPTGVKIIDLAIPVGRGQRELIIGDRQTGKTSICVDAIINQKNTGVVCIYCWIGGPQAALQRIINSLNERGAIEHTVVVAAAVGVSAAEQYLAPYSAAALGEYFMSRGRDVLVVFDDLTKHAWVYRQMSLLLERASGREAYPGDIFYLHSQLLERAGRMTSGHGGGSMTFLPVVETMQGDITGYIQTNLISITDGQIYISAPLFHEGFKPAIDLGLSVSRIGSRVQGPGIRRVSSGLRLEYSQYREMLRMTKLRTNLSEEALARLRRGEVLQELFKQSNFAPVSLEEQMVLFHLYQRNLLQGVSPQHMRRFIDNFFRFLTEYDMTVTTRIRETQDITPETGEAVEKAFAVFFRDIRRNSQEAAA